VPTIAASPSTISTLRTVLFTRSAYRGEMLA
jgi:hypothetical protein